jgi:hypothetical protein
VLLNAKAEAPSKEALRKSRRSLMFLISGLLPAKKTPRYKGAGFFFKH